MEKTPHSTESPVYNEIFDSVSTTLPLLSLEELNEFRGKLEEISTGAAEIGNDDTILVYFNENRDSIAEAIKAIDELLQEKQGKKQ